VAACDKGARQSRAEQWRRCWGRDASPSASNAPKADLDAAAAATAGHFGAMGGSECGWESRARRRRGQCSGEQALVASAVKKGERMGMTCGPGHVMA
jgi:hypothetical protein